MLDEQVQGLALAQPVPEGVQVAALLHHTPDGRGRALLLEAIADKEEVAASDAEVEAEVEKFARASQRPAAAVRRMMEKSGDLDSLRHGLRERRTLDLLIEHARVIA